MQCNPVIGKAKGQSKVSICNNDDDDDDDDADDDDSDLKSNCISFSLMCAFCQ